MKQSNISNFVFGDIQLSQVVHIDGIPHPTRAAIGEWLEYDDPAEGVRKLLNRNSYIEAHGIPVKLTGMGGAREYETLVYHPIGFLLIVMESGTPKAIQMKQDVAEFVWHYAQPGKLSAKERIELQKLARTLYNDLARTKDKFAVTGLIAQLREVCLSLGSPVPDIAFLGKEIDQLPLPGL